MCVLTTMGLGEGRKMSACPPPLLIEAKKEPRPNPKYHSNHIPNPDHKLSSNLKPNP